MSDRVTFKTTMGHVTQQFHGDQCVSQSFRATDEVVWTDESGEPCRGPWDTAQHQPFDMRQPSEAGTMQKAGELMAAMMNEMGIPLGLPPVDFNSPDLHARCDEIRKAIEEKNRG